MRDQEWKNYLQQWQIPPTDPQLVSKIINKLPRKTASKPWQNHYLRFAAVVLFLSVNFYLGFWVGNDSTDLLTLALLSN